MVNELLLVIAQELLRYGRITGIINIPERNSTLRVILYNDSTYTLLMQDGKCVSVKLITK